MKVLSLFDGWALCFNNAKDVNNQDDYIEILPETPAESISVTICLEEGEIATL